MIRRDRECRVREIQASLTRVSPHRPGENTRHRQVDGSEAAPTPCSAQGKVPATGAQLHPAHAPYARFHTSRLVPSGEGERRCVGACEQP